MSTGRAIWSVRVVAAVVLEDEADGREQDTQNPDQEQPPADRHAERRGRGGQAEEQRPPAVRAEEPQLAGALRDLALPVVLGPPGQPPPGEQHVEPGQEGQSDRDRERGGPGRVVREVPVDVVRAAEEHGAAQEQVSLDLHSGASYSELILVEAPAATCSACRSRPDLMFG